MGALTLQVGVLLVFAIVLVQQCAESAPRPAHGGKSEEHHGHGHGDHSHENHKQHGDDEDDDDDGGKHNRHDDHGHDHPHEKHKHKKHDDDSDDDDDDDDKGGKHKRHGDDSNSDDSDDDDHHHRHHHHHHHHHDDDGKKSHEDHDNRDGESWGELGQHQRDNVKIILRFIQSQGEGFTGVIHLNGQDCPVDYILTALSFKRIELQRLHARTLWHILKQYFRYSKSSNANDVQLDYIRKHIRKSTSETGTIAFKGYRIPVRYIIDSLRDEGLDDRDATRQYILTHLYDFISRNYPTTITVEVPAEPTEEDRDNLRIILEFLGIEGRQDDVIFSFRTLPVPAQAILQYVDKAGQAIESVTPDQLYQYIIEYFQDLQSSTTEKHEQVPANLRQKLQEVLNFLQIQSSSGEVPNGYIVYNNKKIATSLILTIIHTLGKSVYQIDINQLYNVMLIAYQYAENNPADDPTNVTLIYILDILKKGSLQSDGYIIYSGFTIPLRDIRDALNEKGLTPEDADAQTITDILNTLTENESTPAPQPLPKEPTQDQKRQLSIIIDFLQNLGNQYNGEIPFSGYVVPIDFILEELNRRNLNLNSLSPDDLYVIILKYEENTETTEVPENEITTVENILNFLKAQSSSGEIPNSVITYDNTDIPVGLIYTIINTSGNTIEDADVQDLYQALQLAIRYVNNNPEEDANYITLIYILDTLKNGEDTSSGYVVYNSHIIPFQNIKDALQTQGIEPENATPDIVLSIIKSQISDETTPATETLGKTPSEGQRKLLLTIIPLLQLDYTGDIVFSGHTIPISFIMQQLAEQNTDLSNLDANTLYYIILRYVDTITATGPQPELIPYLQGTLQFLKLEEDTGDVPTGSITYNNIEIPISLLYTIIEITGKSMDDIDINYLYEAILTAFKYVNENPDSDPTTVNLVYIVDTLKSGKGDPNGYVVYNGHTIPLQTIEDELSEQGIEEPNEITTDILFNILTSIIQRQTTTRPQPLQNEPTDTQKQELNVLVNFLMNEGNNYTGELPFSGYSVPAIYILHVLQDQNKDFSNLDENTLYLIIQQYVDSIQTSTSTTTENLPTDEEEEVQSIKQFLILESQSPQSPTGYITYENTEIPTSLVLTIIDAKGIPIENADLIEVYDALQTAKTYVNNNPDKPPTDVTAIYILDLLQNDDQPEGYVVFNGRTISLQSIKEDLNKQGISPQDASPEIIISVLNSQAASQPTTTPAHEPLGNQPTAEQQKQLTYIVQFIKTQGNDYSGDIPFSGYSVPITYILHVLQGQNKDFSNIDESTLYIIIQQYVESIQTSTSTTTENLPTDEEEEVQSIKQFLILESQSPQSPNGYITYENTEIPTSLVLTIIDANGIPIENADLIEVYHALQTAKTYVNNNPDKTPTDVTAIYILDLLQNDDQPEGYVVFNGRTISLQSIKEDLNKQGISPQDASPEIIISVLNSQVASQPTTTPAQEALGNQPSEEQQKQLTYILQFLKFEGNNYKGTIPFAGYEIQLVAINKQLEEQGKNIGDLDTNTLYNIILAIVRASQQTTEQTPGTTLTPDVKNTLQNTIQLLETEGENSTGEITINGQVIPISYLVTIIRLHQINFQDVTIEQLYQFVLEYIESQENPPVDAATSGIPSKDVLTVQLILDQLKQNPNSVTIVFDGKEIPVEFILEILKIRGKDLQQLNLSELYKIFVVYLQSQGQTDTEQIPPEYTSALQQLLDALKSQGSKIRGSITINSQTVSLQQLWQITDLQKTDVQKLTPEELYRILVILLDDQGTTVDPKQTTYDNIIQALKNGGTSITYSITINGKMIPLSYIISAFSLQKDSSGIYDTSKITVNSLWEVIQKYLSSHPQEVTTTQTQKQTFTQFKEGVAKYNEGYKVTINYDGKTIPIEYAIQHLNLQKDSNGHYNGDSVTLDQLIKVLDAYPN